MWHLVEVKQYLYHEKNTAFKSFQQKLYWWKIRSGLSSLSLAIYVIHNNININDNTTILYCALSFSDGRLQPAFFASLVKHPYTLTGINSVVKFEDVRVNRGQGYDPSTGVFTAPRKGLYHISCLILGGNNGNHVHYQLNKNDARYTKGFATKGRNTSSTISSLVEMKKGDRVFIKHNSSTSEQIHGAHYSTFSGYLLQE